MGGENPPAGLKEMFDTVRKELETLKLPGLENIDELLAGSNNGADGNEDASPVPVVAEETKKCPICHAEWGRDPIGDNLCKCGHCLSYARKELKEKFGEGFKRRGKQGAILQGLPALCYDECKEGRERLLKLLQCYHEALDGHRTEGAELLKEEIISLRQQMLEDERKLLDDSKYSKELERVECNDCSPVVLGATTFEGVLRYGWMPLPDEENEQIILSTAVLAKRSMVDLPMPSGATADDYHREVMARLMEDPVFQGGYVNWSDYFLANSTLRAFAGCDAKGRRAGHFETFFIDNGADASLMSWDAWKFLTRLEHRNTFFTDPEFGYFHPDRDAAGCGMQMMVFMHLPALCATLGLPRLRKIVGDMDGQNCLRGQQGIRLEAPNNWFGMPQNSYVVSIGGFLVLCDNRIFGEGIQERVNNLKRVAKILEKQERAMRKRMRTERLLREEVLDDLAKSCSLLKSSMLLSREEAIAALSSLWMGREIGCFPGISKKQLIKAVIVATEHGEPVFCNFAKHRLADIESAPKRRPDDGFVPDVLWEDQDLDAKQQPSPRTSDATGSVEILGELPGSVEDFRETMNESLLRKSVKPYPERVRIHEDERRRASEIHRILWKK